MSDAPDGSGPIPRRTPRAGEGGAPISGALAIVLAVVAVVAGFLILRTLSDGGESAIGTSPGGAVDTGEAPETSGATTGDTGSVPQLPTTTTQPPLIVDGAIVMVANANGVGGSAGAMTTALEVGPGFEMADPTNSSSAVGVLEESQIYYDATNLAALDVADSLNRVLGGDVAVAPLEGTPPVSDGSIEPASVLLMLGVDKEGQTLEELNPDLNATGSPTVTNPPVGATTGDSGDTGDATTEG
jgi:hypothetical protein